MNPSSHHQPTPSFPTSFFKIRSRVRGHCIGSPTKTQQSAIRTQDCKEGDVSNDTVWYVDAIGRLINRGTGHFLTTLDKTPQQGSLLTTDAIHYTPWLLDAYGRLGIQNNLWMSYDAQSNRSDAMVYLWQNWGSPSQMWYFERLGFLKQSQSWNAKNNPSNSIHIHHSPEYTIDIRINLSSLPTQTNSPIPLFSTTHQSPLIEIQPSTQNYKIMISHRSVDESGSTTNKIPLYEHIISAQTSEITCILRFNANDHTMEIVVGDTKETISPDKLLRFLPHGGQWNVNWTYVTRLNYHNVWKDDIVLPSKQMKVERPMETSSQSMEEELTLLAKISKLKECIQSLKEKRDAVSTMTSQTVGMAPPSLPTMPDMSSLWKTKRTKDDMTLDDLLRHIKRLEQKVDKHKQKLQQCRNAFGWSRSLSSSQQQGGGSWGDDSTKCYSQCPIEKQYESKCASPTIYNLQKNKDLTTVNQKTLRDADFNISGPYSITYHKDFKELMKQYLFLKTENTGNVGRAVKDYVLETTPIKEHPQYYQLLNKYANRVEGVCPPQYKPCPKNAQKWKELASYYQHQVKQKENEIRQKYEMKMKCLENKYKQKLRSMEYLQKHQQIPLMRKQLETKFNHKLQQYNQQYQEKIEQLRKNTTPRKEIPSSVRKQLETKYEMKMKCLENKYKQKLRSMEYLQKHQQIPLIRKQLETKFNQKLQQYQEKIEQLKKNTIPKKEIPSSVRKQLIRQKIQSSSSPYAKCLAHFM